MLQTLVLTTCCWYLCVACRLADQIHVRGASPLLQARSPVLPLPALYLSPHSVLHLKALPVPEHGFQPPQQSQAACLRFIHQHLYPMQQSQMCCASAQQLACAPFGLTLSVLLQGGA